MAKLTSFNKKEVQNILKERNPEKLRKLAEEYIMKAEELVGHDDASGVLASLFGAAAFLQARAIYFSLNRAKKLKKSG